MTSNNELFDQEPEQAPKPPKEKRADTAGPAVSRRRLFFGAGVAAAGVAVGAGAVALQGGSKGGQGDGPSPATVVDGMHLGVPAGKQIAEAIVKLNVNGRDRWVTVASNETLAEVLRQRLGLTGTKVSCDRSECSACSVLVDGIPQNSCSLLAIREENRKIETIEGQEQGTKLSAVQLAFMEHMGLQCGFCTPGQIMQATALLRTNPKPSEADIRRAMSGNLCKCAAYPNIIAAVQAASKSSV